MAVALLVGAYGELGDVILRVVVGHLQHGIDAAGAPLLPSIQQHVRGVGDEVRLPDPSLEELALAAEVVLLARIAAAEYEIAVEYEFVVPEEAHHGRRVGYGDVADRLVAAAVEVLVPRVKRNGKEASGLPLKAILALLILPDCRCAVARNHIDRELVQMVLRLRLAPRLDLDDVTIVGHVAVGDVDDCAVAPFTVPRPQLDLR